MVAIFPVFGQPAASVEPGDRALDNPPLGFHDKPLGAIRAFDDFDHQTADRSGNAILEERPGISTVGEQFAQEWKLSEQSR